MYITWWCNAEEAEEYKKQIQSNNMKISNNNIKKQDIDDKYNVNDIFKKKDFNKIVEDNNYKKEEKSNESKILNKQSMIECKKDGLIKKIFNRLFKIFKK